MELGVLRSSMNRRGVSIGRVACRPRVQKSSRHARVRPPKDATRPSNHPLNQRTITIAFVRSQLHTSHLLHQASRAQTTFSGVQQAQETKQLQGVAQNQSRTCERRRLNNENKSLPPPAAKMRVLIGSHFHRQQRHHSNESICPFPPPKFREMLCHPNTPPITRRSFLMTETGLRARVACADCGMR